MGKKWLEDIVKLPEYYQILIDQGFDDLDSIADINNNDLKEMNIDKIGHRKKILKHAQKLKSSNDPKQQQIAAPNFNYNNYASQQPLLYQWQCHICNSMNLPNVFQCTICGMNKRNKNMVEGPNVVDTAQ